MRRTPRALEDLMKRPPPASPCSAGNQKRRPAPRRNPAKKLNPCCTVVVSRTGIRACPCRRLATVNLPPALQFALDFSLHKSPGTWHLIPASPIHDSIPHPLGFLIFSRA